MMQKEWKGMYIGVCLLSWGWVTANVLRVNLTRLYITVHLFSLFFLNMVNGIGIYWLGMYVLMSMMSMLGDWRVFGGALQWYLLFTLTVIWYHIFWAVPSPAHCCASM